MLDLTPADAKITASFFVIQPNYPVVDALINAHGRGAGCGWCWTVATDSLLPPTRPSTRRNARLAAALREHPAAPSFAMQCGLVVHLES